MRFIVEIFPSSCLSHPLKSYVFLCLRLMIIVFCRQAHLCPLPLQIAPIFWAFDHALALYPAPDGLVLADSIDQYRTSYNQVQGRGA